MFFLLSGQTELNLNRNISLILVSFQCKQQYSLQDCMKGYTTLKQVKTTDICS